VRQGSTLLGEYAYDGLGRRSKKTVSGTSTYFHYDRQGNLIAETSSDGTPLRDFFYQDGKRVAMRVYGLQAGMYYFINDHLDTPRKLIDESGQVVWQAAYLPFGKAQVLTETVVNNFRFPGQYYDEETGLHYNYHRYYDPKLGRYLRADPIGLDGEINLYAYVGGNPVNRIDPEGLAACFFNAFKAGCVKFVGCSSAQRKKFRVIPESGKSMSAPSNGWNCSADGFWAKGKKQWYKVPGYCHATVTCSGNSYSVKICCNKCVDEVADRPKGWQPDSGGTEHGTDYPF